MKIEIDIDIESIVKAALKKKQEDEEETPKVWTEAIMKNSRSKWEYGRRNGRRRTVEEMALHDLEKEKGRRLTPEEKGEAKAVIQIDETTENTIKEAAIKKDRIDKIAAEGMAAAEKELAEEKEEKLLSGAYPEDPTGVEVIRKEEPEATIPETKDLDNINSLFSK
tara:strand:- start:310 stop:807 length:498 start_codon:yes stop_codon:yes gene_type:complete